MTGFETYQLFLALRNHFKNDKYDFFKYKGKVNAKVDSYEKRKDTHFFRKVGNLPDPKGRIVCSLVEDISHIQGIAGDAGRAAAIKHEKISSALRYNFQREVNELDVSLNHLLIPQPDQQYPLIIQKLLANQISLETVVVLDQLLTFIPDLDTKLKDDILWPDMRRKIVKYTPFVQIDKSVFRQIAIDAFCSHR